MGLTFSSPGGGRDALDDSLNSLLTSLRLGNEYITSTLRSVSFNGRSSEPVLKAWGSGKLMIKGTLSFNARNKDKDSPGAEPRSSKKTRFAPTSRELGSPKHEAALKLQKVYKSFRTRRQLADCAVLVEQRWWKLLDFAMLRSSSVSFFDLKKNESAVSKWARAKRRAAKVGKGLSKDEKAQKLALQHWLEAIDPRHRYGHNLHFYYSRWLLCESKQPFFYWLDVGDGKEVSIDETCHRSKLQQQCIKYLGPKEREVYEVIIEDGKLLYKETGQLLDTTKCSADSKCIFVLSTTKNLYVGQKKKGIFQHSSFLAGGATSAAGRLEVDNGILKAIWPHSGHYRPTEENFQEFVAYLKAKNVDLTDVKMSPVAGEEGETFTLLRHSRSCRAFRDLIRKATKEAKEQEPDRGIGLRINAHKRCKSFDTSTDSPKAREEEEERARQKAMLIDVDSGESEEDEEEFLDAITGHGADSIQGESTGASSACNRQGAKVPSELIMRRMKFKKESLSLQLGNQLTCRWTTGAGPRIGCVMDSPSVLRFRALEQVSLSPRSGGLGSRAWSSTASVPSPIPREDARGPARNAHEASRLK